METVTQPHRRGKAWVFAFALWFLSLPAWTQSDRTREAGGTSNSSARNHRAQHTYGSMKSANNTSGPILTFSPGIASTVAGTGVSGYSGDGGPGTSAQLSAPMGMAVDSQGNLYEAEFSNNVVRKLSTNGNISTVAGNGTQGYSGDGGSATSAQLSFPTAVAIDGSGNLYIADYFNFCVRKVDLNGVISTLASASGFPVRGVAADAAGNVFFSSSYEGVWKVDTQGVTTKIAGTGTPGFGGDGGPAIDAQTSGVAGLAVDGSGNLYLAEVLNSDIRKIDTDGIITTVAGNQQFGFSGDGGAATSAKMNGPTDVKLDAAGDLYIIDSSNNRVRKVNRAGTISSIVGDGNYGYTGDGGLASRAQFAGPSAIAIDGTGALLIADTGNNVIRKVSVDATTLDFGSVIVGQSSGPVNVIVSNAGNADLSLTSFSLTAGFGLDTTCSNSSPLTPGSDCLLSVSFSPTVIGNITGSVIVGDNATGNPHVITLKGQGAVAAPADFGLSISAPSLNVGRQSSASVNVTVTPTNGFSGAVTLSCHGLPSHSTCTFNPVSVQADGNNHAVTSVVTISTGLADVAAIGPAKDSALLAATGGFGTGLLGLVFAPMAWRRNGCQRKRARLVQLVLAVIILCMGLVGCGSLGGQTHVTPAGSYTVTVTGTSTGASHSRTFTLVVQ